MRVPANGPGLCLANCKDALGDRASELKYVGLQYDGECFCSTNSDPKTGFAKFCERTSSEGWKNFNATYGCTTVTIGNSRNQEITVTQEGLTKNHKCPAEVSRNNWLGGHTWPDVFDITQSEDQVTAKRVDAKSGWGMNLEFECCKNQPEQKCKTVTIGSSGMQEKTVTREGLTENHKCPAEVSRKNWAGTDTWGDTFEITQNGNEVTAKRKDAESGWGMYLQFKCCTD